jgi:hypothetical protein
MERMTRGGRRLLGTAALALLALTIGAVVAVPGSGRAGSKAAPVNTSAPTISGTPQEGSTLTADKGSWTGDPTSYEYSWSRCDANGNSCSAITGATSKTYELQDADVGKTLRVSVTASNPDGANVSTSAPTAVVSASAAPGNSAPPTISGTVQVGGTLTATTGTWSANPTSFAYAWSRCDQTGGSCAAIGGATSQTYQLKQVDAGATLRVSVTATNSAGSTTATSVPTAVVPATVVNGCPATGTGTLQAGDLAPPARLELDRQALIPAVVTPSASTIQLRVRVTACSGRPVQGALVYATAVPYNQYTIPPEATSGSDGFATLTMTQLSGFPAARKQRLLVFFLRARKAGDPLAGGISTRLLVSFPVSLG